MLSNREYLVAELISWGASDKEVAEELYISPETAKSHRKNIFRKIEAHNAADLTRWFFSHKFKLSFGLNPRLVKHLAVGFLCLVLHAEFTNTQMIRTRTVTARVTTTRVKRKKDE